MLTMNWKELQSRRPKQIKKKVKHKKYSKPKKVKKNLSKKELYNQQLKHPLWAKKRLTILKRDEYKCRLCGSKHNLQVHHIKYSKDKKAWEYPNLNLITLCEECHKKVHADLNHDLNPYNQN